MYLSKLRNANCNTSQEWRKARAKLLLAEVALRATYKPNSKATMSAWSKSNLNFVLSKVQRVVFLQMSVVVSSAPDRLRPSTSLNVRRRPRFGAVRARHAEIFPQRNVNTFVQVANIFDWIVNVYLFKHAPSCQKFRFGAERAQHAEIFPRRIVNLFLQVANIFEQNINLHFFKFAPSRQQFRFGAVRVRHAEIFPLRIVNTFVQVANIFDQIVNAYLFKFFTCLLNFLCGAGSTCWDLGVVDIFVQVMKMP